MTQLCSAFNGAIEQGQLDSVSVNVIVRLVDVTHDPPQWAAVHVYHRMSSRNDRDSIIRTSGLLISLALAYILEPDQNMKIRDNVVRHLRNGSHFYDETTPWILTTLNIYYFLTNRSSGTYTKPVKNRAKKFNYESIKGIKSPKPQKFWNILITKSFG